MRRAGRIAVVGAGPAGLVAAIAGRKLGLDVALFEQAPEIGRVGGGIGLQSNGLRVLAALDLLDGFEPRIQALQHVTVETPDGRVLTAVDYRALEIPQSGCQSSRTEWLLIASHTRCPLARPSESTADGVMRTSHGRGSDPEADVARQRRSASRPTRSRVTIRASMTFRADSPWSASTASKTSSARMARFTTSPGRRDGESGIARA